MTGNTLIYPVANDTGLDAVYSMQRAKEADPACRHQPPESRDDRDGFLSWYNTVRAESRILALPLAPEDMVVQSMPDVSPTKWHLAHASWFFETFLLAPYAPSYVSPDTLYSHLFNSYYESIGHPFSRPRRGLLSRPTVKDILDYRARVDEAMASFIRHAPHNTWRDAAALISLGLNHEQQHQELILTDIKHVLAENPMAPAAYAAPDNPGVTAPPAGNGPALEWQPFGGCIMNIGHDDQNANSALNFAFDNESPQHERLLRPFFLAKRLVTNGEYHAFIDDGGYQNPLLWLADGWTQVQAENWTAPLYWRRGDGYGDGDDGDWQEFTLSGLVLLNRAAPVCHLSYYEADAFARWAGARLPSEDELEHASCGCSVTGNFGRMIINGEARAVHPWPSSGQYAALDQIYGDVWEWTHSAYASYPGYRPARGAVGEYNGKFMCGQYVLRGGSCATPTGHVRRTYRNFFPPGARWQFSGLRLARDA